MHPLGVYLAIKDNEREHGASAYGSRDVTYARVDATPILTPAPESWVRRHVAIVRRRALRVVGA